MAGIENSKTFTLFTFYSLCYVCSFAKIPFLINNGLGCSYFCICVQLLIDSMLFEVKGSISFISVPPITLEGAWHREASQ